MVASNPLKLLIITIFKKKVNTQVEKIKVEKVIKKNPRPPVRERGGSWWVFGGCSKK
jgi:hypothetical protein